MNAAAARPTGDVLLYLNGVTVSFDGFKALNDLSLVVEEGELRTIIGPIRARCFSAATKI
jgi:urea transport system ATP-binding protein